MNKSKNEENNEENNEEKKNTTKNTTKNKLRVQPSGQLRVIDLFAGTGAFSYVWQKYGHKIVMANDMVKESEKIYKTNFPTHNFILNDLNKITLDKIPPHDVLCGGFPCQPFSIAGKRQGFDDSRSNVFWKIMEILKSKKPKIIILENVKNLLTHDDKNTFKIIEEQLTTNGYNIAYGILDTCKITEIPQHRERIYIIGFTDRKLLDMFEFDFEEKKNKKIKDFLELTIQESYYYTNRLKVYNKVNEGVIKNINQNVLYQYRRHLVRENKSNCCPTLTANMGIGGHNVPLLRDSKGVRKLTPRECFNLQGFPATYKLPTDMVDSKLYKLAGNAVSVPVVELIVQKILQIYNENK